MVAATVTLSNISVTIPSGYPTSVDYGVLQLNSQAVPQTYTPANNNYLRVQNNGGGAEDLVIKGTNATCGAGTWTIGILPGANTYSHLFGAGMAPSSYMVLGTGGSTLASNVAVYGTVDFNLKIQTPSSSTVYGKYSTTVSIIATAH